MSSVIYTMNVSLDGFVTSANRELNWVIVDEEVHSFINDLAREMGTFLYGRWMYELMADFWPTADADPSVPAHIADFAHIWREKPKIVFSTTLTHIAWNSRLARDGIAEEIAKLKEQPGNDMGLCGPTLAATFMQLGLIDEYRLFVQPVVLGAGTPFFPALDTRINLRFVETRPFDSGVVYLRYVRADAGQDA